MIMLLNSDENAIVPVRPDLPPLQATGATDDLATPRRFTLQV